MKENPLVTVCSPCYNHEKYLDDYFASLLNQTYKNIELIIIDDASKDASASIIDKWLPKLNKELVRVIFIQNSENQGLVKNNNKSLSLAKGDYIKFFATDDIMQPVEIEKKVEFLQNNPEYGMCYGNGYVVSDRYHYNETLVDCPRLLQKHSPQTGFALFYKLLEGNFIPAPTVVLRKSVFERFGQFDEAIGFEDYEYWVRIARFVKMGYIGQPTVCYRKSQNSMTDYRGILGQNRLTNIIVGNKKIIKKYIHSLDSKQRIYIIQNFYVQSFILAIRFRQKKISVRLYCIIRDMRIPIKHDLKKQFIMLMINPIR
jgi:glycosyltransferase involved in cell wall biosynthesis